jgi:hypothetical protein
LRRLYRESFLSAADFKTRMEKLVHLRNGDLKPLT